LDNKELKFTKVQHKILKKFTGTLLEVEKFMKKYIKEIEKDYKYNLTQSQNVLEWINKPQTIDPIIRENLEDLKIEILKFVEENPKIKSISFLDVGCYCGYILDWLKMNLPKKISFKYLGIDIRKNAIDSAKNLHKDGEFKIGNVSELKKDFGENEFDIVFCLRTLIHLPFFEFSLNNLLYVTKTLLFVIGLVEDTSCQIREQININTGNSMKYFFRSVSEQDLQDIAASNKVILTLKKHGFYTSTIFWK